MNQPSYRRTQSTPDRGAVGSPRPFILARPGRGGDARQAPERQTHAAEPVAAAAADGVEKATKRKLTNTLVELVGGQHSQADATQCVKDLKLDSDEGQTEVAVACVDYVLNTNHKQSEARKQIAALVNHLIAKKVVTAAAAAAGLAKVESCLEDICLDAPRAKDYFEELRTSLSAALPAPASPAGGVDKKVLRKLKNSFEELVGGLHSQADATQCVKDLKLDSSEGQTAVTVACVDYVLNTGFRANEARGKISALLQSLITEKVVSSASATAGMAEIEGRLADISLDAPLAKKFFAELKQNVKI